MEASNPIIKMLEAEIKRVHDEHEGSLLTFRTEDQSLPVGQRSDISVVIILKRRRVEEHRACAEIRTRVVSCYHDTFTMKIPSIRTDKKKCEARILFEDGDVPADGEDFVRQAIPPIAHTLRRDTEELLPWGRQVNQLQVFIKSDLSPWVTQQMLFLLSGCIKSTPLFSRVVPRESDTANDEDVVSFAELMEATRPGAIPLC